VSGDNVRTTEYCISVGSYGFIRRSAAPSAFERFRN
jgi:hypothetical protein